MSATGRSSVSRRCWWKWKKPEADEGKAWPALLGTAPVWCCRPKPESGRSPRGAAKRPARHRLPPAGASRPTMTRTPRQQRCGRGPGLFGYRCVPMPDTGTAGGQLGGVRALDLLTGGAGGDWRVLLVRRVWPHDAPRTGPPTLPDRVVFGPTRWRVGGPAKPRRGVGQRPRPLAAPCAGSSVRETRPAS
jgi:hypothetical protein